MKRLITLLYLLFVVTNCINAQIKQPQPFGEVDTADLKLRECDFEKDAKAMILFDKALISTGLDSIVIVRHKRIKIFNDNNKEVANIRLPYYSRSNFEEIPYVQAQTIRLENNKIVITKLDPKQIYTEVVDKNRKALVFAFPDVKAGCIIEYKYKWKTLSPANFPPWFFQNDIPERYNEITAFISYKALYKIIHKGKQPFLKDTAEAWTENNMQIGFKHTWAKSNIHSLVIEPFMPIGNMNLQCLVFSLHSISGDYGYHTWTDTWLGVAKGLIDDEDFGDQLRQNISNQDVLLKKADSLKTVDAKIAYLFTEVRKSMKWNSVDTWYTDKGIRNAWSKKTGNSTEINLILYHLLTKAGVNAYPMEVSTRENGAIHPINASYSQINKTVTYVPIDSTRWYVLDATSKYNTYNEIPAELLNTFGLVISQKKDSVKCNLVFLENKVPAKQACLINAEIKTDSKVTGTATIISDSYNKATNRELYDRLGETKYKELLTANDNHIKISNIKLEDVDIDSLQLTQTISFNLDLTASDDNYIYFNPNIFTPLHNNPFLSEQRFSDIDFGSCNMYTIAGIYKIPPGYKVEALPANITLMMFDKSIIFKRIVGEVNGNVELHYSITNKRSIYTAEEYQSLHDYYKKLYDMLNEPIVLKKSI